MSWKFSLEWNVCKIKMSHPKNIVFSWIENLNIKNYHDTKKLTVSQKISPYMVNFFACDKNVTTPPSPLSFLDLFIFLMTFWNFYFLLILLKTVIYINKLKQICLYLIQKWPFNLSGKNTNHWFGIFPIIVSSVSLSCLPCFK